MALNKDNAVVGFIGIGIMGKSMAGHIQAAGYPLHIYDRAKERSEDLVAKDAIWHDSVAGVAATATGLVMMLMGDDTPEPEAGPRTALYPVLAPGHLGMGGRF